jgi:hypothetical protein
VPSIPNDDYYIREAEDAQQWAERSKTDKAKAIWLRIAQSWLKLVRGLPVECEAFDRIGDERGTDQTKSTAWH